MQTHHNDRCQEREGTSNGGSEVTTRCEPGDEVCRQNDSFSGEVLLLGRFQSVIEETVENVEHGIGGDIRRYSRFFRLGEDILEKPLDEDNAVEILERLSGNCHGVITAFALVDSRYLEVHDSWVESKVHMRKASMSEIRAYVETGESMDKAGAYAVQGEGARFVDKVEGSLHNVIGLPVAEVLSALENLKNSLPSSDSSKEAEQEL